MPITPSSVALLDFRDIISWLRQWSPGGGYNCFTDTGGTTPIANDGDNVKCVTGIEGTNKITEATVYPVYDATAFGGVGGVKIGANKRLASSANITSTSGSGTLVTVITPRSISFAGIVAVADGTTDTLPSWSAGSTFTNPKLWLKAGTLSGPQWTTADTRLTAGNPMLIIITWNKSEFYADIMQLRARSIATTSRDSFGTNYNSYTWTNAVFNAGWNTNGADLDFLYGGVSDEYLPPDGVREIRNRVNALGVIGGDNILCIGDSITAGTGVTTPWPTLIRAQYLAAGSTVSVDQPWAVAGWNLCPGFGAATVTTLPKHTLYRALAGRRNIAHIALGANDLCSVSASTFLSYLYLAAKQLRNSGYWVSVSLCYDRNDATAIAAGYRTKKNTVNTAIANGIGTYFDIVVDPGSNLTSDTAADNSTYFNVDKVHPNDTGQALIVSTNKAAFDTLLARPLIPTAATILSGTIIKGVTGTLNASNLNTALANGQPDLTAGNVRSGTVAGNITGTLIVPATTDVRNGVSVDSGTGSLIVPAASDVRLGTAVDAESGTLAVPDASQVLSGASVDAGVGTLNVSNINTALGNGQPDVTNGVIASGIVAGDVTGSAVLTAQAVRDAMLLAPSGGTPAAGSFDAMIEALSYLGNGAYSVTVTVNDGTNPLEHATVRLIEGANVYTGQTDASGEVVFALDAATYSVAITKDGYTFTPTTSAVTDATGKTFSMTQVVIPAPSDPAFTTVYGVTYSGAGVPTSMTVYFELVALPNDITEGIYHSAPYTVKSSATDGTYSVELPTGAVYRVSVGGNSYETITPTGGSYAVPALVG